MGIIVKFLINNIKEKKFRTCLIILSVAASAALFFASMSIADTFEKTYLEKIKNSVGDTDIYVSPNAKAQTPYINIQDLNIVNDYIDYKTSVIFGKGAYKNNIDNLVNFNLYGYDYKELMKMSPLLFSDNYNSIPFEGKKIIISKDVSNKYHLTAGNRIKLNINGANQIFTISAIAERVGLFKNEKQSNMGVVPIETLASLYNEKGKSSITYIKLKNPNQSKIVINKLSEEYKNYDVGEVVDKSTINQEVSSARTPFLMMLIMVVIMSVFIIFTAFKVITLERLPYIGTFRSIGATKNATTKLLLMESVIYGVIGGIIGDLSGIAVLYIMADSANEYKALGVKTIISYKPSQLVYSFVLAVIISFISAFIPIIKVSKISVKDIILNNIDNLKINKRYKLFLGLILVVIGIFGPYIASKKLVIPVDCTSIIIVIVGILIEMPYIATFFVFILEKLYLKIFGNEGILAIKNIKNNKSIINNIALLTIGAASIFMINTVSFSFGKVLTSAYNLYNFDIFFSSDNGDSNTQQRLLKLDGVKGVQGFYAAWNLKIEGSSEPILETDGVDKEKFLQYLNVNIEGNTSEVLNDFDNNRNVIITNFLKEKLGLKKGDYITFKMQNGDRDYKVVGFFESSMQNGSIVFIPERFFKLDTGNKYFDHFAIKTDKNIESIKEDIQNEFIKDPIFVKSVQEFKKQNADDFSKLISMLGGFSIISIVIGIFGVLNNFIISFIERKHSLAIMCSVGMSKTQRIKMLTIEALTIGIIGGLVGTTTGIFISAVVPLAVKAMGMPFSIFFSWKIFTYCIIAAVLVTLIASIGSQIKASNINIVKEIKYE